MYKTLAGVIVALVVFPLAAQAQGILIMIDLLTRYIEQLIPVLMALAVLVFLWGIVKFMTRAGDEASHEEGKNLMVWGMIALFVMVGLWGIVGYIQNSFGIDTGVTGNAPNTPISIPR
jgi:uncharacterized protein with PQ loop repeat